MKTRKLTKSQIKFVFWRVAYSKDMDYPTQWLFEFIYSHCEDASKPFSVSDTEAEASPLLKGKRFEEARSELVSLGFISFEEDREHPGHTLYRLEQEDRYGVYAEFLATRSPEGWDEKVKTALGLTAPRLRKTELSIIFRHLDKTKPFSSNARLIHFDLLRRVCKDTSKPFGVTDEDLRTRVYKRRTEFEKGADELVSRGALLKVENKENPKQTLYQFPTSDPTGKLEELKAKSHEECLKWEARRKASA